MEYQVEVHHMYIMLNLIHYANDMHIAMESNQQLDRIVLIHSNEIHELGHMLVYLQYLNDSDILHSL